MQVGEQSQWVTLWHQQASMGFKVNRLWVVIFAQLAERLLQFESSRWPNLY